MAKKASWVLCCLVLLSCCAFSFENVEQKAEQAIKNFVLMQYPDFSPAEVRVTLRAADEPLDKLKRSGQAAKLKIIATYPDFKAAGNNVIFPVEMSDDQGSTKLFLRAKVELLKQVAAAAKGIKKGELIKAADLKFELRDVAQLPKKYFVDYYSLINKEAKLSIPENSTILDWMVGELPLVKRGSQIALVVSTASLKVKTRAEALEDGYLDKEIKVRRQDNKKIIKAKVISANEVEVKL